MRQLNLQLYGRTAQKGFSELLSIRKIAALAPGPTTIELSLTAPGSEKFVELRLDPDDKPSSFALHDLRVRSAEGGELYRWNGCPESLVGLIDLRAWSANDKVLIESGSNDPFLLIPLAKPHSGTLVMELSVSQALDSPGIHDGGNAVEALGAHQQELADAVRSLQASLRLALDDLASEQEGLQDALVVQYAHSRSENDALRDQLSKIVGRTASVETMLQTVAADLNAAEEAFATKLKNSTRDFRNEILAEVRDDWRSLKRQIEAGEEAATKKAQNHAAALAAAQEVELAKLMTLMRRFAAADEAMKAVRAELGVSHDEDAISKLKNLKAEARDAQDKISALENSLCWRLMRPFSSRKAP